MFERYHQRLLPRRAFASRVFRYVAFDLALLAISLGLGTLGYHLCAGFVWIDAFLNASMILTGMGPVGDLTTAPAKLFASCYALFSGVVFVALVGVVVAPLAHRFLHRFHLEGAGDGDTGSGDKGRRRRG
jgi:hypothetical protein